MRSRGNPGVLAVTIAALLLPGGTASAQEDATDGARRLLHGVTADIGVGYDTNPFLAPDEPYFDQNRKEYVDPVKQPGFFIPVRVRGGLQLPLGRTGHTFVTDYRLKGSFYTDDLASNADEAFFKIEPGAVFNIDRLSRRSRIVDLRVFGSLNRDVYFDRDTGIPISTAGIDVSQRFNYRAVGVEMLLDYEINRPVRFFVEGTPRASELRRSGGGRVLRP